MITVAAAGPSALWYLTRGTGTTSLILLTASLALGVANIRRVRTARLPRFVFDEMHRTVSLLAVVFLVVHIITTVLDPFAPITLIDAVIPFTSAYRPLWLGLGAVASDLMIAVIVTSVLRRRVGYSGWRFVHFLSYLMWPVAVLHTLGTGSDAKAWWMLALLAACVATVLAAVVARAAAGWPGHREIRISAVSAAALLPIGLLVWLPSGPLGRGWAKRAGTPASLLSNGAVGTSAAAAATSRVASPATQPKQRSVPTSFNAAIQGVISQGPISQGRYAVRLSLKVSGEQLSTLRMRIFGQPLGNGGVSMTASSVTLGTEGDPTLYKGQVTALRGTEIEARVQNANGAALTILAQINLDPAGRDVSGAVTVQPA
jgi:DMSO/TMAO reductase YedYZ heme-binding membrane subunit